MSRVVTRGSPSAETIAARRAKMADAAAKTGAVIAEMRFADALLADLKKARSVETITAAEFACKSDVDDDRRDIQ